MAENNTSGQLNKKLVEAGFKIEKVGKTTTILSRPVPDDIIEASRVLTKRENAKSCETEAAAAAAVAEELYL